MDYERLNLFEATSNRIHECIEQCCGDAEQSVTCIKAVLCAVGLSPDHANLAMFTPEVFGALDGLGYALTHIAVQKQLFPYVANIIAIASDDLRNCFVVAFSEPFATDMDDSLDDEGFLVYMSWFYGLSRNEGTKWIVDDSYALAPPGKIDEDIEKVATHARKLGLKAG